MWCMILPLLSLATSLVVFVLSRANVRATDLNRRDTARFLDQIETKLDDEGR
jgi:hypothetical protein